MTISTYTNRAAGTYAQHRIYIDEPDMEVINFVGEELQGNTHIQYCILEEFKGHALFVRLVAYDVSQTLFATFFDTS